mmetsp:Transcript_111485/g.221641  ORF Transcript_111485/g.221641 Transcript_111485/m.221641 type:complete len:91 (-) Transcript_111485:27-299(-)
MVPDTECDDAPFLLRWHHLTIGGRICDNELTNFSRANKEKPLHILACSHKSAKMDGCNQQNSANMLPEEMTAADSRALGSDERAYFKMRM